MSSNTELKEDTTTTNTLSPFGGSSSQLKDRMKEKKMKKHISSDSEIINDLHKVFKSVDIDDEGLLDQASFMTALFELGVDLPYKDLEAIFNELDKDDTGYIEYETVLKFIKNGKIPSTLLNKIKKEDNGNNVPVITKKRRSILIGKPMSPKLSNQKPKLLIPISENQEQINKMEAKLSKDQKKLVDRAIIVIKKAAMKNIKRDEVVEFLMDKGLSSKGIELAYLKAQEKVMSKDEQIKHLQALNKEKVRDLQEQINMNKFLSNEATVNTAELELLRNIVSLCVNDINKYITKTNENEYENDETISKEAAQELTQRIKKAKNDVESAFKIKDNDAIKVFKRDLNNLNKVSKAILSKQYRLAYLSLFTLPPVIRSSIPNVIDFLSEYDIDPDNEKDDNNDNNDNKNDKK